MTSISDPGRLRLLEEQIPELQTVYGQLVAYADDLNRTYQELRRRLYQMTALSAVATRLAGGRSVEACTQACLGGIGALFPQTVGRLYIEDRRGVLKPVARPASESLSAGFQPFDEAARSALASEEAATHQHADPSGNGALDLVAVRLKAGGKVVGALVAGRKSQAFDEDDVHLVELLANTAAVAIANAMLYQQTRKLAITDPTTGLFNFRYFRTMLSQEVQRAKRFNYPIGMIMADIDHFKSFNDVYGHPVGNLVLRRIGRSIRKSLRQADTVARYGGEEFAAVLPGCDKSALFQVAEKVRQSVTAAPIRPGPGQHVVRLTISVGGAWQDASSVDASGLVAAADRALYVAKALGRDRSYIQP